jgi:hypothetical protein
LLIANAIVIGGLLALVARAVVRFVANRNRDARPSLVPGPISVPPPH